MMKAKDLMIGDIVRVAKDVCLKKGTVVIVHGIDADNRFTERGLVGSATCVAVDDEDRMSWGIWTEFLEPVPLTVEILEKNGWKHEFDKTEYMVKYDLGKEGKNCWMMWSIKEHNLDVQRQDEKLDMYNLKVSRVVIPCDYVHQLQHSTRMCGIEKDIKYYD